MKEAVKCCMQVWMCIYGLKNVKVAIEASTNYSYIVDACKEGYEVLVTDLARGNLTTPFISFIFTISQL